MGCYVTWTIWTLLLFGWSLSSCSQFLLRQYFYINNPMTWYQARKYCRQHYTDLATFESHDDITLLEPTFSYSSAWIGMFDDPKSWKENLGNDHNSWRWSVTGETGKTNFSTWASEEPSFSNAQEACVFMNTYGTWEDTTCHVNFPFVCYTVTYQREKVYHFIPTMKSWNSAQQYCRENFIDLAMIENAEENAKVLSKIGSQTSWIGLYRVPWTWSDRSYSSFKNWNDSEPTNSNSNQHCVAEQWPHHKWQSIRCPNPLPFICQKVMTLKTTVGMQIMTDANLTDPAVIEQFVQQIRVRLTNLGWTDFNLQWRNLPSNQTK